MDIKKTFLEMRQALENHDSANARIALYALVGANVMVEMGTQPRLDESAFAESVMAESAE